MDELTKKKRIRAGHRGSTTKIVTKIRERMANLDIETDRNCLRQLRETLSDKIGSLKVLDETIIDLMSGSETENADEELADEIEETDNQRAELKKVVLDIDETLIVAVAPGNMTPVIENQSRQKTVRAKLPKLEVKKFSGKVQEWQEFWDSFDSAVNKNECLSDVDKFSYLRSLLVEPARSTIAGFALTGANYEEALDLLKKRFGKKISIQKAHIQELMNVKAVYNDRDTQRLRKLYDTCETNHRGLKALGVEECAYSTIVVPGILEKLPESFRLTMTRGVDFLEWSMAELLKAFLKEIELREAHSGVTTNSKDEKKGNFNASHGYDGYHNSYKSPHSSGGGSASALFTRQGDVKCAFCLQEHPHEHCKKVTNIMERKRLIRKYGRCFICLKKGHIGKNCASNNNCNACGKRHHRSICEGTGVHDDRVQSSFSGILGSDCRVALQTAQGLLKGEKGDVRVRVLFDSGSHRSFVTTKAVQVAGAPVKRKEWIEIKTFGQEEAEGRLRDVFELEVLPIKGGESVKLEAYGVRNISEIKNEHVELKKRDYPHLKGLWFSDVCKEKEVLEIEVLIGADYLWCFQEGKTVRGKCDEPVAVHTKLGWVLSGPMKGGKSDKDVRVHLIEQEHKSSKVCTEGFERLWDYETLGIKEEDEVHESLKDSIKFNGTRYSVCLPWKEGHSVLPSNYSGSLKRLKGQVAKLRKEPEILKEYDRVMNEQLEKGMIEPVVEMERAERVHYIPHHAVVRKDAKTTKVRVVYDASCKESNNGTSLNDCLHVGPPLAPLLFHILLRFRTKRVAVVADIEKAFLNVEIDQIERDCLRFLWVKDVNDKDIKPVEYRFCRVVFGVNCSPFLLNATLQHHLDSFAKIDPQFVRKIKDCFYVDDLVGGEQTDKQALLLYEKVNERLAVGGFKLRKWRSNSEAVLEKIKSVEEKECREAMDDQTYAKSSLGTNNESGTSEKVLGIGWNCKADTFEFSFLKLADRAKSLAATKRNVLSVLAGLYDPLGIISPVAVSIKMLFQELCFAQVAWDDELEGERKKRWLDWVGDLERVGRMVIARCVYGELIGRTMYSLHGFADASLKAYCAVVYFVSELNGGYHVELLTSKTRIAPMKAQTIPRLELMSARILAKLMDTVKTALGDMKFSATRYWLDSKTALCWINNRGEWKQFVRHRVNEILKLSKKENWGHCPGVENPADLGSRGVSASCLKESDLWWRGPKWLPSPMSYWPLAEDIADTTESLIEVKKTVVMEMQVVKAPSIANVIDVKDYSRLINIVKVMAWVKRFISNVKAKLEYKAVVAGTRLKAKEIIVAESELIKSAQLSLKARSDCRQLVSQLGLVERDGVLRCKGRLGNADLEREAREPIILPKEHWLTEVIIRESHERVHHCGLRATLAELRSRFWVPRGRQVVKKVIGRCVVCKKQLGKPYGTPVEADLPEFRVQQSPPFSKVGVDFAGPLYAKEGSEMVKVYIALFTCCVTRAVHLDLVRNLSAASFLNCLRRFTSRRGAPTLIVSDNAKTFKAAEKALKGLYGDKLVEAYMDNNCLKWQFNLERAPWWGGFFERMVGLVKGCLRKVLGKAKLTYEELLTTLVEVEGTLNSRPLTYEYNEEIGSEVLTPSHLIFGRRLVSIPDEVTYKVNDDEVGAVKKRFRYLARMRVHFWKRWRKEYLTNLREYHRGKKRREGKVGEVGDVVLVFDENLKRGCWKMGRVESLMFGRDRVVRGAKVKVMTSGKPVFLNRPLQKLYPLEVSEKNEIVVERNEKVVEKNEENSDEVKEKGGNEGVMEDSVVGRRPRRAAALDARWKTRIMFEP